MVFDQFILVKQLSEISIFGGYANNKSAYHLTSTMRLNCARHFT